MQNEKRRCVAPHIGHRRGCAIKLRRFGESFSEHGDIVIGAHVRDAVKVHAAFHDAGSNFILLSSPLMEAPLNGWMRAFTNSVTPGSFTIPAMGSSAHLFYTIQSQ